jgi:transposase InsO family protein
MSWKEVTIMSQRVEFINLALQDDSNISELCRRFKISRKTGYKFLNRYETEGFNGLYDQPRRPINSPNRTDKGIEKLILNLRDKHPTWGGRKLKRRLEDLGHDNIPSPSTITAILQRHDKIFIQESQKRKAFQRFCAKRPNDLWQMDFKGQFQAHDGTCYPLTILDDHSRFSLCIAACRDKRKETVREKLENVFSTYGLPLVMLVDNGAPWGDHADSVHTKLTVWLMRLGIRVIHSRPYHPQTLGKEERFHRTLKEDVITECSYRTIEECQDIFDRWRAIYNRERPHEALDMQVPFLCYSMSHRPFPRLLPDIEYYKTDTVRKVHDKGKISFKNKSYKVGRAFIGQSVAIRPTNKINVFDVYFINHKISQIIMT